MLPGRFTVSEGPICTWCCPSVGFLTAFQLEESGLSPLNGQGLKQAGYIQRVAAL